MALEHTWVVEQTNCSQYAALYVRPHPTAGTCRLRKQSETVAFFLSEASGESAPESRKKYFEIMAGGYGAYKR
jgi:hypothetical protein